MEKGEELSSFQVYVRVRPIIENNNNLEEQQNYMDEQQSIRKQTRNSQNTKQIEAIKVQENILYVIDPQSRNIDRREKSYIFNDVYYTNSTNQQVFETSFIPNINYLLQGYNATFFAYGMTGAGKTHTIFGNIYNHNNNNNIHSEQIEEGTCQLTIQYLFKQFRESQNPYEFNLKFSYIEIYNEQVRDLLSETDKNLNILDDTEKGVIIQDLIEVAVHNQEQVDLLLKKGNKNRALAPTLANQVSSRSHAIIQLNITAKYKNNTLPNSDVFTCKLRIIDLAGSEKASNNDFRGQRGAMEGSNINKSLLALGNCINILSDKTKSKNHVPFRNSKLTRLLKDSLGGNTRTIMIACITPNYTCLEETINTLNYASRAKTIKNKIFKKVNEDTNNSENSNKKFIQLQEVIHLQKSELNFIKNVMNNCHSCKNIQSSLSVFGEEFTDKNYNTFCQTPTSENSVKDSPEKISQSQQFYIQQYNKESTKSLDSLRQSIQLIQDKDDYLQRIIKDLISNQDEYFEISKSIQELMELINQNKTKIDQIKKKIFYQGSPNRYKFEEDIKELLQSNNENVQIKEKLQEALNVNQQQKNILLSLLSNFWQEYQREISKINIQQKRIYQQNYELKQQSDKLQKQIKSKDKRLECSAIELEEQRHENHKLKQEIISQKAKIIKLEQKIRENGLSEQMEQKQDSRKFKKKQEQQQYQVPGNKKLLNKTHSDYGDNQVINELFQQIQSQKQFRSLSINQRLQQQHNSTQLSNHQLSSCDNTQNILTHNSLDTNAFNNSINQQYSYHSHNKNYNNDTTVSNVELFKIQNNQSQQIQNKNQNQQSQKNGRSTSKRYTNSELETYYNELRNSFLEFTTSLKLKESEMISDDQVDDDQEVQLTPEKSSEYYSDSSKEQEEMSQAAFEFNPLLSYETAKKEIKNQQKHQLYESLLLQSQQQQQQQQQQATEIILEVDEESNNNTFIERNSSKKQNENDSEVLVMQSKDNLNILQEKNQKTQKNTNSIKTHKKLNDSENKNPLDLETESNECYSPNDSPIKNNTFPYANLPVKQIFIKDFN